MRHSPPDAPPDATAAPDAPTLVGGPPDPPHPPEPPEPPAPPPAEPATMTLRPFGAQWARDFVFHSAGLVLSVVGFTLWVTAVSVSLSLAIFVIGLFAALGSFYVFRWFARIERRRAALLLDGPIPELYRDPPRGTGWFGRLKAMAKDPATWKDFSWTIVCGTLGFVIATAVLALWGSVLALIATPLWYSALPEPADYGLYEVHDLPTALLTTAIGVAMIPVAGALGRGLTIATLAMMVPLLRPSRNEALEERVEVLTATRANAVDAQAAELQRIERDLHDGAQARLVALALNLGMAEAKFDSDPDQARELLAEARGEARTALTELRDLARGIHPPILTDRGLAAAITALAARSPLSVSIDSDVTERLPPGVEAAAYFVVAESLANAAKHSRALRVLVRLARLEDRLVVEIADDGIGGANPNGSGLLGLRRRVEALDGRLAVVSPRDGGTTLHAELPCAPAAP